MTVREAVWMWLTGERFVGGVRVEPDGADLVILAAVAMGLLVIVAK